MLSTKFARDHSGASVGLTHWKWGSRRTLDFTSSATRSTEALDGHTVFIEVTERCHLRLGGPDVVAVPADPIMKPGVVYAFPRALGETHISVVAVAGRSGGGLEYWQADDFVEA